MSAFSAACMICIVVALSIYVASVIGQDPKDRPDLERDNRELRQRVWQLEEELAALREYTKRPFR